MTRTSLHWIMLGIVALLAIGCTKPKTKLAFENPEWKDLPRVPHPDFVHWSSFPVGTTVLREKRVKGESPRRSQVELVAKSEKEVTILHTDLVDSADEDVDLDAPRGRSFTFPATFPLPEEVNIEDFDLPAMDAKLVGTEKVSIADGEYETKVFEWKEQTEAGPMNVKYWQDQHVPGRLVKQLAITVDGDEVSEQIVEVSVPEETQESN